MSDSRHVAVAIIYSPNFGRVLMITSRAHPDLWILPKGGIEKGETSGQAAVREAWEEAGSPQTLKAPSDEDRIAILDVEPASGHSNTSVWHVHVLEVQKESEVDDLQAWPEKHERRREWVSIEECLRRIKAWNEDDHLREGDKKYEKKEKKVRKKAIKSDTMEMAIRKFIEIKGLVV